MLKKYLSISLKSVSQVFFVENIYTGLFFLAAIAYAAYASNNYALFIAAVIGALLSNAVAMYNGYDEQAIESGLYGFNGVLLAMSVAVFIQHNIMMWFIMIVGIVLATVLTQAFKHILTDHFGIPGSTGPFVFCGWLILFAAYQFSSVTVNAGIHPHFIENYQQTHVSIENAVDYGYLFFKNIGQVYFLSHPLSGLLILVGISIGSPVFAAYVAMGSVVTIIVAECLGVDNNLLFNGLYGFSPVLTALAVGCVFIERNFVYAVLATVVTVFIQASLYSVTAAFAVPTFTSAYVLTMYLFVAAYKKQNTGYA